MEQPTRVFSPSELEAYEAGREDAARDIERMLSGEIGASLQVRGIPRSVWVIKYDDAIAQARGMSA